MSGTQVAGSPPARVPLASRLLGDRTVRNRAVRRAGLAALAILAAVACQAADPALPAAAEAARKAGRIEITASALQIEPSLANRDDFLASTCRSWKLSESDLRHFFVNASPITPTERHDDYDVLPCEYTGTLTLDGKPYEFVVNGGSHGQIRTPNPGGGLTLYGCRQECAKLFPFGGSVGESEP